MKTKTLRLSPEVSVDLLLSGRRLLGLGQVTVNGIPIRSGEVPLRPEFSTPDAIQYQDFVLTRIRREKDLIILETSATGRASLYGEMMDEYSYNLAFPRIAKEDPARLDWILRPSQLDLDGQTFLGFSLGFEFESPRHEIHRFSLISTAEIGARATGNTSFHQAYSCDPVYRATKANAFSSTCLKRLDLSQSWLGHSYQMLPRWGCIQPFDFFFARQGVLLGLWQDPHSVKSLLQKNAGEDVFFVIDEYNFPLSRKVTIPPKHLLFSASPGNRPRPQHAVIDLWTRAFDYTREVIAGFFGIKPARPAIIGGPDFHGQNSISREDLPLGPQKDWMWKVEGGKFYFQLMGEKIESHDLLHWYGDRVLPKLAERGVKRFFMEVVLESDFTEDAFAYHAETGWHGDLHVGSVCATRRNVPAEFFGGWKGWNYMAAKARALGIQLGHWVGLHLSPRAAILRDHPEYLLQHVNTLGHGGGYSHQCICSINWASGARQWFLDDLRRWHDEGGLDFLFFDSWPNLGCAPINFGGRMEPMQWELGGVLADLQSIGYDWFSFEGTSPFGVHRYGLWDPMAETLKSSQGILGQNDFGAWIGHEYLGYQQSLIPHLNPRRKSADIAAMSFRYLANGSLTLVSEEVLSTALARSAVPSAHQRIYQQAFPFLQKRHTLPADRGVRWEANDGTEILFAYKAFPYALPTDARVVQLDGERELAVATTRRLQTQPRTVYKITR